MIPVLTLIALLYVVSLMPAPADLLKALQAKEQAGQ